MKLTGTVMKGQGFATLIFGLPTANLDFDEVITLKAGVYIGYVQVRRERYQAVIYIGPQGSEKFEVHLFDFQGDLYGQELEVEVIRMVSEHVPWESEEQMKAKVAADVELARASFRSS
jgi:riboflavin kinase/FMN adenylyltransferase